MSSSVCGSRSSSRSCASVALGRIRSAAPRQSPRIRSIRAERHGGVGLAVVPHHRVHHLAGSGPEGERLFGQRHLLLAAQSSRCRCSQTPRPAPGSAPERPVRRRQQPSSRAGVPSPPVWVESTTVGRATGWHAHDRQHRQDHCKAAAAHAGKIVDAKDFFGFNRVYQIRNLLTSMRNEQCAF